MMAMVKIIMKNNRRLSIYEECELSFLDKGLAEKCQNWCKTHCRCNLEITRY